MKNGPKRPGQHFYTVRFEPSGQTVQAPTGALLSEVMHRAGLDLNMPCGGQGRCGRCAVIASSSLTEEAWAGIRRRSTLRLSVEDLAAGYALACQTVLEGDAVITLPPQEQIERRLVTDRTTAQVALPFVYDPVQHQPMRLFPLVLEPPSLADQTDDWSRLKQVLSTLYSLAHLTIDLPTLHRLGVMLRESNWAATAVIEMNTWDRPNGPPPLSRFVTP